MFLINSSSVLMDSNIFFESTIEVLEPAGDGGPDEGGDGGADEGEGAGGATGTGGAGGAGGAGGEGSAGGAGVKMDRKALIISIRSALAATLESFISSITSPCRAASFSSAT